jgi:alpha-amylase/alpha-mannosidase (GH57 family)
MSDHRAFGICYGSHTQQFFILNSSFLILPSVSSPPKKSSKPIRLALLWHQHQPYYRAGDRFILPWVWLHATKDYLEMAQHLEAVPTMKATINLVPSLMKQIEEYLEGKVEDPLINVLTKPSEDLTDREKAYIRENCFHANYDRMIARSPRYKELHALVNAGGKLTTQDYRDLVMHYQLAWTGEYLRQADPIKQLVEKDRDYTEADKTLLMSELRKAVAQVLPLHRRLMESGQIELSTTPFYHPIMPLLCDTNAGREAVPGLPLPQKRYREPDDARLQLQRGRAYASERYGTMPQGVWPSEGSLSETVLGIMTEQGVTWTATDEAVLTRSLAESVGLDTTLPESNPSFAKYFPFKYVTEHGEVAIFFRDHALSDNIGFVYQSWNAKDAVADFVKHVEQIRTDLITHYGEEVLDRACISVILDGENCWEYYERNGYDFLRELYTTLSTYEAISTCTMSDAIASIGSDKLPKLTKLTPGSWINANFNIWIGHAEDNLAWDELYKARCVLRDHEEWVNTLTGARKDEASKRLELAREELLIAEGSDWCWWYGDDHFSAQKEEFDALFRMHLRAVYVYLDKRVPASLGESIMSHAARLPVHVATHEASTRPEITGLRVNASWQNVDEIDVRIRHGAMHKAEKLALDELRAEMLSDGYYIRVLPRGGSPADLRICLKLKDLATEFEFEQGKLVIGATEPVQLPGIRFAWKEALELALGLGELSEQAIPFAITLSSESIKHSVRIPQEGWLHSS